MRPGDVGAVVKGTKRYLLASKRASKNKTRREHLAADVSSLSGIAQRCQDSRYERTNEEQGEIREGDR